jgi:hypothetical protein
LQEYRHEASLLDAAVIYGAFREAARLVVDTPDLAELNLRDGPRAVNRQVLHRTSEWLQSMFYSFWEVEDFLCLSSLQDAPPGRADFDLLKQHLGLTAERMEPLYEVLGRAHVSPAIAENLTGLLTDEEIEEALPLLRSPWPQRSDEGGP